MPLSKNILKKESLFCGSFIVLFTIALYLPSLKIPFINDEIYFIQRNEVSTPLNLYTLFEKKDYDGYYYRPLPNLVSGVSFFIFHYNYRYYRIFNVLLHAAAALLVYFFIIELLALPDKKIIALFSAVFFSAFPLHDYSVIWHTDLFDRIMILFYLAGLISFIRNKFKTSAATIIFFTLALLSKEMAFSFPLIIALINFFFNEDKFHFKKSLLKAAPYFIVAAIFIIARIIFFNNDVFTAKDAHSHGHLFDVIKNYIIFSGLLSFPFYIREIQNFVLDNKIFAFSAAAITLTTLAFFLLKYKRRDYPIYFFILFYLITLAPASRLLMRWYLYLPSIGFTALLSYLIFSTVPRKFNLRIIVPVIILVIYSGSLFNKELIWVKQSNASVEALKSFIAENKDEIVRNGEADFITVPAKVNDIPIFQLGFDYLFNYYLGGTKKVKVEALTKSYIKSLSDPITVKTGPTKISLSQIEDNYFILFNNEKNIKFEPINFKNGNLKTLTISLSEVENKILYTFSNGKFYKIKGL